MTAIQEKLFDGAVGVKENSNETLEAIRAIKITDNRYVARFARSAEEIDAALRLRFEVFNLELEEGLEASYITGRDEDEFDQVCHHLLVIEQSSGAVVGTYRLQTLDEARSATGFYCAGEFELENFPRGILSESLEIGRACIARDHRNMRVLFLLWKGLAAFAELKNKRYLFGCCSLTSQTEAEGWRAWELLERENHFHPAFMVPVREDYICAARDVFRTGDEEEFQLPKLFHTYLRFGAKVCSDPAIDRRFKTIDFFVMFDIQTLDEKYRQMFFA